MVLPANFFFVAKEIQESHEGFALGRDGKKEFLVLN